MQSNREIIIKVLGITEHQYGDMVMNYAYAWINKWFQQQEIFVNAFTSSKHFWAWWVEQWNNRDAEFLRLTGFDRETAIKDTFTRWLTNLLYEKQHNIDELFIHPNSPVYVELKRYLKEKDYKYTPPKNAPATLDQIKEINRAWREKKRKR